MSRIKLLLEIDPQQRQNGFEAFEIAAQSETAAFEDAAPFLDQVAGLGVELDEALVPVPMFAQDQDGPSAREVTARPLLELASFATPETNADLPPSSVVLPVEVDRTRLEDLQSREGVRVWPNSPLVLFGSAEPIEKEVEEMGALFDQARSAGGLDTRPFRPGVTMDVIRTMLGVKTAWLDGFRGQNVTVGILDDGVNGTSYPISGGFARRLAQQPGAAPITSHGSMCAADVLVAAPAARLYDYPFLGVFNSGGALTMFQAVLDQRRLDGTPHLTTNSYGFPTFPRREEAPNHEVWDINHPLHRKIREVVTSGAACFFAAGNCGANSPSGNCHPSSTGPGRSIHGANSLAEVITVAAVNSRQERIGYSSQGPGMFAPQKPDLASYSHFFGNFGPGRPGGTRPEFDSGTSAATPVAAGVGALLLSAVPGMTPAALRNALMDGLINVTGTPWDPDYGRGIVNAAASYSRLTHKV